MCSCLVYLNPFSTAYIKFGCAGTLFFTVSVSWLMATSDGQDGCLYREAGRDVLPLAAPPNVPLMSPLCPPAAPHQSWDNTEYKRRVFAKA